MNKKFKSDGIKSDSEGQQNKSEDGNKYQKKMFEYVKEIVDRYNHDKNNSSRFYVVNNINLNHYLCKSIVKDGTVDLDIAIVDSIEDKISLIISCKSNLCDDRSYSSFYHNRRFTKVGIAFCVISGNNKDKDKTIISGTSRKIKNYKLENLSAFIDIKNDIGHDSTIKSIYYLTEYINATLDERKLNYPLRGYKDKFIRVE